MFCNYSVSHKKSNKEKERLKHKIKLLITSENVFDIKSDDFRFPICKKSFVRFSWEILMLHRQLTDDGEQRRRHVSQEGRHASTAAAAELQVS